MIICTTPSQIGAFLVGVIVTQAALCIVPWAWRQARARLARRSATRQHVA